jgi:hypothetical protein
LQSAYGKALIESVNNIIPGADFLIIGLDTPVAPLKFTSSNFFDNYTIPNISLLMGFQVDAFVLVINEFNDVEYIIRNVNCLKSLLNTDVLFIIYNSLNDHASIKISNQNIPIIDRVIKIAKERFHKIKNEIGEKMGIHVYDFKDEDQCSDIIEKIINIYQ